MADLLKISYATCCKQHAAAASKPAVAGKIQRVSSDDLANTKTSVPSSLSNLISGKSPSMSFKSRSATGGGIAAKGGTCNGKNCYRLTGKSCPCENEGEKVLHTDGGKCTGATVRVNCNNCDYDNYEATGIIQFTSDCKCGGDKATIKHLGPAGHSSDNPGCCWEIGTVTQAGKVGFNMEGPHPKTSNPKPENDGNAGNAGSLANKKVGIKSIIWKISGGYHHEVWVDPSGAGTNWTRYAQRNVSKWGVKDTASVRPAAQQIEFRNDCHGAKWLSYNIAEIYPPT